MRTRLLWGTLLGLSGLITSTPAQQLAASPQQAEHFQATIKVTARLDYLLFLPEGYAKSKQRWPLMLFLHGAGESGTNLDKLKVLGPPKIVESKPDFPFVLVSPQTSREGWNPDTLNALLDDVLRKYRVDKDRVYLTGASMGGSGTWRLAAAHPERFAAIVPICGRGDPAEAKQLARLPIWVFHGAKDPVVRIASEKTMVEAIQAAGGNVKFTIYPDAGHDAWTETYNNPELYEWLLKQKRRH
jgi:predicted peptidase